MRLIRVLPNNSRRTLLWVGLVVLMAIFPAASSGATDKDPRRVSVIVREQPFAGNGPERLVERLGGRVGRHISIIDGFAATVPARGLRALKSAPGVHSVTPNRRVRLLNELDGWDQGNDVGSTHVARTVLDVDDMFGNLYTGKGIDVALIDSGVVPVDGLTVPGKIVNGADLSFESQVAHLRHLDTFGHGTHLAGLIAGRDDAAPGAKHDSNWFQGVAPDARIVSVKVADAHGVADVSQVIAAIDWVVQHRRDNGLNIRVLNLSFGTDGVQDYRLDPLTYAVEVAWRKGIAVVVAAGNSGFGSSSGFGSNKLNNPAYDPFVIAVGAVDPNGTFDVRDDVVPSWSSSGDGSRNPDFVAPGKSLVSLRAPGSHIDLTHPTGRVGATPRFFRGSGTSQAAAVVSGVAALVIQARPTITPDQLKALLKLTALPIPNVDAKAQGAGRLNLAKIARNQVKTPTTTQLWPLATGTGSIDQARGTLRLTADGVVLDGERDIFGAPWNGAVWAPLSLAGTSWAGGLWNGNAWSGNAWTGNAWSGNAWEANAWEANAWSANAWEANAWEGNAWSGNAWEANAWLGNAWEANAWSGNAWSSNAWGG